MKKTGFRIDLQTWGGFLLSIKEFAASKRAGRKGKWLFSLLILFLLGLNGLNVLNSYVGRDFMTAIEDRNRLEFIRMALTYIGVFAASTIVSVMCRYAEESLGLVWREWATRKSILSYATHRVYYRLKLKGEIGNPDQRIADDIRVFSTMTLSFMLMVLNGSFTVIAFSGVLWTISPRLFVGAVIYASAGTFLTFLFGRPLIRLNYDQLDKEAELRSSLIHLRGNAESIALSRREGHLVRQSLKNLGDLASNFRRIISINRRVNFFTTGYNWLIQVIPALIVAPLFFDGRIEFGVITQSAIAFTQLLGAFSLIVTQFQSISSYTAVFARLAFLREAGETEKKAELFAKGISSRDEERIAYENLTLRSRCGRVLVKDLSIEIPHGKRTLVRGQDETAGAALFQATAGLWQVSDGRIIRPALEQILLVPEMPYLPQGTVRELFMRPLPEEEQATEHQMEAVYFPEELVLKTLRKLGIEPLLRSLGGFDQRHTWANTLPLDKQQLMVVARILLSRPLFAFLDRPASTLQPEQLKMVLRLLEEKAISYVTFESKNRGADMGFYDTVLNLGEGGGWKYMPPQEGTIEADYDLSLAAA